MDGGDAGLIKFIKKHLDYPAVAKSYYIESTVKLNIVVDSLGILKEEKV